MSGSITDTWTSPARRPDGKPLLDEDGKPVRVRNARWGVGDRWQVRWRDEAGVQRAERAPNKDAAKAMLQRLAVARASGTSTDPSRGRRTVGHYADRWLQVAGDKPSAKSWNKGAVRSHIRPRWGDVAVADVTTAAVREWGAQLARTPNGRGGMLSASRRRGLLFALGSILQLAVEDRAMTVNPVHGVPLPRVTLQRGRRVNPSDVHELLAALRRQYAGAEVAAMLQAYGGIRWAELVALDVADFRRTPSPRLLVDDAVVEVDGVMHAGPTKTHAVREAPLPQFVAEAVDRWLDGRTSGPLVPGPRGGRYRRGTWRRHWERAVAECGIDRSAADRIVRPHHFRHAAASQAIGAGADVKVVQAILGHASAAQTLDTYGHLLSDRLGEVTARMETYRPPLVICSRCAHHVHSGPAVKRAKGA